MRRFIAEVFVDGQWQFWVDVYASDRSQAESMILSGDPPRRFRVR